MFRTPRWHVADSSGVIDAYAELPSPQSSDVHFLIALATFPSAPLAICPVSLVYLPKHWTTGQYIGPDT